MPGSTYTNEQDWLNTLRRFLTLPYVAETITARGIEPSTMESIGAREAHYADALGYTSIDHGVLAADTGASVSEVQVCRVGFILMGLEDIVGRTDAGGFRRQLQLPAGDPPPLER